MATPEITNNTPIGTILDVIADKTASKDYEFDRGDDDEDDDDDLEEDEESDDD